MCSVVWEDVMGPEERFISGKCSVVVCPTGYGGARIGATAGPGTLAGPRVGAGVKDGVVDISHSFQSALLFWLSWTWFPGPQTHASATRSRQAWTEMHRPPLAAFPVPHSLKPESHIDVNFPNSEVEEQARTMMIPPVLTHPKVVSSELELLCSSKKGGSQIGWALEELMRDQYHNSLSPSSSALSAPPTSVVSDCFFTSISSQGGFQSRLGTVPSSLILICCHSGTP